MIEHQSLAGHIPHVLVRHDIARRSVVINHALRVATTAGRGELGLKLLLAGHLEVVHDVAIHRREGPMLTFEPGHRFHF